MSYNGYLLQIGDYQITGSKLVEFATYEVTRKVQDLEPFRDATGVLHRNSLPHIPLTVEFQLVGGLSNTQLGAFFGNIQRNYINALERKVSATVYVPETDEYITQDMYLVEPTPKIRRVDAKTNTLYYEPLKIKLIGY